MDIIKKDGRLELFDTKKLSTSIGNAASDGDISFTESDLHIIVKYVENELETVRKEGSKTSSYEIKGMVIESLLKNGFKSVLNSYLGL